MSLTLLSWNTQGDPRTNSMKRVALNTYLPNYDYILLHCCETFGSLTEYYSDKPYKCHGIYNADPYHTTHSLAFLSVHDFVAIDDICLQNTLGKYVALIQDRNNRKRYFALLNVEDEQITINLNDLDQFLEPCRRHQNSQQGSPIRYAGDYSGIEIIVTTNSKKIITGITPNSISPFVQSAWCCLISTTFHNSIQQHDYIYYWRAKPTQSTQLSKNPQHLKIINHSPNGDLPLVSYWK